MALFEYISLTYYYYGPFTSQTLVRGAWCKSKICTIFFSGSPLRPGEKKVYPPLQWNMYQPCTKSCNLKFYQKMRWFFFQAPPPPSKTSSPLLESFRLLSPPPPIMLVNSPYFMFVMNDTISIHPIIIIDLQIYFKPPKRLHWLTAHGHITSRDNKDIIWYNLKQSQVYSILFSSIHKWTYTHIM